MTIGWVLTAPLILAVVAVGLASPVCACAKEPLNGTYSLDNSGEPGAFTRWIAASTCGPTGCVGCHGEYVEKEEEIGPAIKHAYASGRTAVVHVCIDPKANSEEMPNYGEFRTWYAEGTQ